MVNKPGYSFGPEHPVHFKWTIDGETLEAGWRVWNVLTKEIYAENMKNRWEACDLAMEENAKLGFGCKPDISAIDSTP